jgi:AefR-like transcriptional repressor, C-terminal domain
MQHLTFVVLEVCLATRGRAIHSGTFSPLTACRNGTSTPEVAAAQFLDACVSTIYKPMLFNYAPATPDASRVAHVVDMAARAFLAAYREG